MILYGWDAMCREGVFPGGSGECDTVYLQRDEDTLCTR